MVNMVYMQRLLTLCYIGNIIERFTSLMYNHINTICIAN